MTDYTELVKDLRDTERICRDRMDGQVMLDAADAIEALQAELPKRGEWNNHEVACLLAEMFGDDCACNLNGIDEWLPQYCEFAETCCPNPVGVACWEQFLKHRANMEVQE